MAEERAQRRLVAILAADVVGYSRLMRSDEAGTLAQLKAIRKELLDPKTAEYGGRIVKTTGDGILIEFPSAVDAVQHAVDVQGEMALLSAALPEDRRMEIRIGINVGDVIVEDGDLFGDGVNVAARLEGLAKPGGICVSGSAYEQVRHKLDLAFEDMGEQAVKNIDEPVRVYRVGTGDHDLAEPSEPETSEQVFTLPDKPSIAVLPFDNLSGDPEQEYFADGITEDIITALSRIGWLFVIARNTTFTFKGTAVDVAVVAKDLGVRYVLEGSVRKAGSRVRITAQLIDGETGNHIWAERYDRELEDIFAVQDEITENISGALEPQIIVAENVRSKRKTAQNLDAWDLVIRAMARIGEFSRDGSEGALTLLDHAIEIDPTYARAYSHRAWTTAWRALQGWDEMETALQTATEMADKAIQYDAAEPWAYIGWVFISIVHKDNQRMMSSAKKAIELNPNFAYAHSHLGAAYALGGRGAEAFEWVEKARRLSPRDMFHEEFDLHESFAHFQVADYEQGAAFAAKASVPRPEHIFPHLIVAACHGHTGNDELAQLEVTKIQKIVPNFSLATAENVCVFIVEEDISRFLDGLQKAGLAK